MSDDFSREFKNNMDELGLPCPESLFGTLSAALATIMSMADVVARSGPNTTVAAMFSRTALTRVVGTASHAVRAAEITKACSVIGGLLASYYLGACIGSLIVAAWKAYGVEAYSKISSTLTRVSKVMKKSISQLLETAMRRHPMTASLRTSVVLAGQFEAANHHHVVV